MDTSDAFPGHPSLEMLDRYLAGECSPSEASVVRAYLGRHPKMEYLLRHADLISDGEKVHTSAGEGWNSLARQLGLEVGLKEEVASAAVQVNTEVNQRAKTGLAKATVGGWLNAVRGPQTLRRYVTAAACVALGAIVIGLGRGSLHQQSDVARTYTTRTGQLAHVTLSDGTQIVLGPQTTMRIAGFGSDARTVDVDGLASFNVSRAGGAPFIVRTGGATTRVLGTQFIVQRYGAGKGLHVAVVDGKVAVTPGTVRRRSTVVLTAGEVGEISDSLTVVRKADNMDNETSWLRDELAFRRAPVAEVLDALTRWYGYRFRLGDSTLTHESISIALSTHSASGALLTLKHVLDVDLTFTGDTVTLIRRNAHRTPSETRRSTYDVWTPSKEVGR